MSVGRRFATVIDRGALAATRRVPLDVSNWADWTLQQVQETAGGNGTAAVYGSALRIDDERLADLDPATNSHWELDAAATWAAPGAAGARSVRASDNNWATILAEITVAVALPDFAVYFFGKER